MSFSPRTGSVLTISLSFVFLLAACSKPKEPQFLGVDQFQVKDVRGNTTDVSAVLKWYNPNPYIIQTKGIDVQVFLNDRFFGTAKNLEHLTISASDTFLLPMEMQIENKVLLKNSMDLLVKKEALLRVEGSAVLGRKGIYKTFPVQYSKLTNWK
jgi:LEA14-like dessication related protein